MKTIKAEYYMIVFSNGVIYDGTFKLKSHTPKLFSQLGIARSEARRLAKAFAADCAVYPAKVMFDEDASEIVTFKRYGLDDND